jgi:hypothetical protein
MNEKKHIVYETDVMGLPSLRLVIGDIPSPDPDKRNMLSQPGLRTLHEKKGTVKRIIAHLEEK